MPMMPPIPSQPMMAPQPSPQGIAPQTMNPAALQRKALLGLLGGTDGLPVSFTMPKPYTPPMQGNNGRPHRSDY